MLSEEESELVRKVKRYNKKLKEVFGYERLKPEQFNVINSVIQCVDTIGIFATGAGKSLNYQMVHLITKKCVIVISPLISLIVDQNNELTRRGIKSIIMNSTIERDVIKEEKRKIMESAENHCIIFMTPEYCSVSESFIKQLFEGNKLRVICIDECHCVSGWADFRQSYSELSNIKRWVPDITMLCLSATMTRKILDDVINILRLDNPNIIKGSFNRENLYYEAKLKTNESFTEIIQYLEKCISNNNYAIIYCLSKKDTNLLADEITNYGIVCKAYNAGYDSEYRARVQEEFIRGDFRVICATISFGLGINIPNVEYVIHYNCPKSMESYMQEVGRGGRNHTLEAKCYLYYSKKDFNNLKYFLANVSDPALKRYQEEQINRMEIYCYSTECRRKLILQEFGEEMNNCGKCDNCLSTKKIDIVNFYVESYYFLNLIDKYDEKFGITTLVDIIMGKSKIKGNLTTVAEFGIGCSKTIVFWKNLSQILKINGFIESKKKDNQKWVTGVKLTRRAKNWLTEQKELYPNSQSLSDNYNGEELLFENIKTTSEPIKKKLSINKKDSGTRIVI